MLSLIVECFGSHVLIWKEFDRYNHTIILISIYYMLLLIISVYLFFVTSIDYGIFFETYASFYLGLAVWPAMLELFSLWLQYDRDVTLSLSTALFATNMAPYVQDIFSF